MKWQSILLIAVSTILISCFHDGNDDINYFVQGPGPALEAADKRLVTPCPNQDILVDATELAALKDALLTGALSFLDVPFDSNDADNFKKKCGFETFWDPANNINEVPDGQVGGLPITLSKLLSPNGNAGICSSNAIPPDNITGIGFPVAGTYRGEIKAALGNTTWHLRYRALATGTSAGKSFLDVGINVPADVEDPTKYKYKVDGADIGHALLYAAIVNAISTDTNPILLEVIDATSDTTIFSLSIEVICVTKTEVP